MNITTHLILISAQAIPNITPLLDERFRPKKVIMLVSPDMRQRADDLEAVIKPRGVKISRYTIDDAWNIEHIRDRVTNLLIEHVDEPLALNATGGTKPMSIAAYEVFRENNLPIFYVHPEKDRLIWMHPAENAGTDLQDRIKLREYLLAYGATVIKQGSTYGVPANLRELTGELIRDISFFADALKSLNYYALHADNPSLVSPPLGHNANHAFDRLLDLFRHSGVLEIDTQRRLIFPDKAARFYANGGWLEDHVYGICLNLKAAHGIQDIGRTITVERSQRNDKVRNELDVALLKDNRFYVIECKTANFGENPNGRLKSTDVLYKLDALTDLLGGLQARALLVSYHELPDADKQRARDLRIEICSAKGLQLLQDKLVKWLSV